MTTAYACTTKDRPMNLMLLMLAVFITYMNATLAAPLVVDDITQLNMVRSAVSAFDLMFVEDGQKYFRPLGFISFYIDLKLFRDDPATFHIINILLHLCNAVLVYLLALRLYPIDIISERTALVASMLFALHPVNSESVIWISARFDLLCCLFLLLTMFWSCLLP